MKKLLLSVVTSTILLASNHDEHKGHEGHDHSAHSFEPVVSIFGDFSYVNRSEELHGIEVPGFVHAHEEGDDHGHDHSEGHGNEGFNFNSAELEVEAPIDEHLELRATFHLGEDSFEVEELYGTTHNRDGINFRAGKFLSAFGLNNSKHSETWDFANQALTNNLLFGSHGLNEKGLGASWNNKNIKVGLEVLSNTNEMSLGNSEIEDRNVTVEGSDGPELNVAYLRYNNRFNTVGFEGGISYAKGKARWDHTDADSTGSHALTGDVTLTSVDTTFTFPFTRTSNIKWSTEYIQRKVEDGTRHAAITATTKTVDMDQSGINTALVYTINPKYRVGLQYDTVLKNDKIINGTNTNKPDDLKRTSMMVEYAFSAHNKLRVQYNKDESKYHEHDGEDELLSYNEVIVQWMFAFSTGEHKH